MTQIRFEPPTFAPRPGNPTPYRPVVCLKCKSVQWAIRFGVSYHCGARTSELTPDERLFLNQLLPTLKVI